VGRYGMRRPAAMPIVVMEATIGSHSPRIRGENLMMVNHCQGNFLVSVAARRDPAESVEGVRAYLRFP
jgi:hypothetical protein